MWREEKLQGALSAQRELKEQVSQYHADFEREKSEIFDISADMTRQCATAKGPIWRRSARPAAPAA